MGKARFQRQQQTDEQDPDHWRAVEGSPDWEYQRKPSGGFRRATTKSSGPRTYLTKIPEVLGHHVILGANGEPINERLRVRRVDGLEVSIYLDELEAREGWVKLGLPGKGRGTRDGIYDMLKDWADALPLGHGLAQTGWHKLGGIWRYAHLTEGLISPPGAPPAPDVELLDLPTELLEAATPLGHGDSKRALQTAAALGAHVLTSVAAGLRSLIATLAPARAPLYWAGEPYTGKTLVASTGRALSVGDLAHKRYPTATFEATPGGIELAVSYEHDLPVLVDDFVYNPDDGDPGG